MGLFEFIFHLNHIKQFEEGAINFISFGIG